MTSIWRNWNQNEPAGKKEFLGQFIPCRFQENGNLDPDPAFITITIQIRNIALGLEYND